MICDEFLRIWKIALDSFIFTWIHYHQNIIQLRCFDKAIAIVTVLLHFDYIWVTLC